MNITEEQYEELLTDDWSPAVRAAFEREKRLAEKRRTMLASLSERAKAERLVWRRQQENLREFHKLLALQFEATAWERREKKPLWSADAINAVERTRRGILVRIATARREAAEGCRSQDEWLARHAELIGALEQPQRIF
jgi:hypothetical protein